jgi:hypothetical protein
LRLSDNCHSGWNIAQLPWKHYLAYSLRKVKVSKENGAVDPLMVRFRIASMLEDAAMLLTSREVVAAKTFQHGVRTLQPDLSCCRVRVKCGQIKESR